MHIELDLSNILEVIAIIISWMCGKVNLNSEKVSKNISICLTMFSICFLALSCLTFGSLTLADYFIMALLSFFSEVLDSHMLLYFLFCIYSSCSCIMGTKRKRCQNGTIICQRKPVL